MFQHVSTCFNKILGVPVQLRGLILYPTYSEHHQLVDESLKAIKVDFATCLWHCPTNLVLHIPCLLLQLRRDRKRFQRLPGLQGQHKVLLLDVRATGQREQGPQRAQEMGWHGDTWRYIWNSWVSPEKMLWMLWGIIPSSSCCFFQGNMSLVCRTCCQILGILKWKKSLPGW